MTSQPVPTAAPSTVYVGPPCPDAGDEPALPCCGSGLPYPGLHTGPVTCPACATTYRLRSVR